ncbi:M56 family metallopeptidase [uncultured Draconibacterium sp.]|uniref:M56 family metallopeptidase n=1 Tax=uncultured Draconibacterium sp. TaxID=1573823 RepID=UPI0025EAD268|nr:M56 family metallopeptidase [uncultured Draconibacterium sp.]
METLLQYLLNASAGIALFFMVYWLFLRHETFHAANRWFLVASLFLAIMLPLIPVQYDVLIEAQNQKTATRTISDTFKNIPVFAATDEATSNFGWQQALLLVYLTGAAIFFIRLLTQTLVLIHLMMKYRVKSFNGVRIVENEKYGLPFSFFNIVFLNPKFHTQDDLPEILAHEKVHIRENHWFDLLMIELLTVIFWFNPFIWLFERAIKQNHEYLADKSVLAQGHTVGRYQALLVNQLMGMQIIGITNNLNFALSTNRLKMMTKKKTSARRLIKLTWALPALALLLFAFAEPQYTYKNAELIGNKTVVTETKSGKELTIVGKVVSKETGDVIPGASIVIKGSTVGCVSDRDGTFTLVDDNPTVKADGSLSTEVVVSFVGLKTVVNSISASGSAINKAKHTFQMEEAVQMIYNRSYTGEQLVPPPPPPPPASENKTEKIVKKGDKGADNPPPPPPATGEKEVFFIVEDMPKYPGGFEALSNYIEKMQKKIAVQKKVSGKAKVSFTVSTSGKVTDIKVVEKDNDMAAKGAYMLANEMQNWTPGYQRGKAVSVKYVLPVEFK